MDRAETVPARCVVREDGAHDDGEKEDSVPATAQKSAAAGEQNAAAANNSAANPGISGAKPRGLTLRQEEFCQAYILTGNATRAAIRAGYGERTARQQASRMLTNVNIARRISELRRDLGLYHRIDRDTVLAKLEAAYRGAITGHMFMTAVRAAEAQGRLAGLFPERLSPRRAAAALAVNEKSNGKKLNGAGESADPAAANGAANSTQPALASSEEHE